jgi:hypothetical protein
MDTHTLSLTFTHTYIHTYIRTYIHTCMQGEFDKAFNTLVKLKELPRNTYIHVYISTHIHTYIHTQTYTYIHTYIYTYIQGEFDMAFNTVVKLKELPRNAYIHV